MRLIDLDELRKRLDDSVYVDPYEIPGFLKECEDCPVVDAIPIHFMLDHLRKLQEFIRSSEEYQYDCFTKRNWPIIKDTIFGLINQWRLRDGQN